MPAFFCELFSEEIPARLQGRAAEDFARLLTEALSAISPTNVKNFSGPRRIAVAAELAAVVPETRSTERGPRVAAPEAALQGFLRKYSASRDDVRQDGDFWVLDRATPALAAPALIASVMPALLRRFPWPKSMRWGGTSGFTWIRPLRRIVCLLDGAVVPFSLAAGDDDGHGLTAGNETEGHRFMSPGPFAVTGAGDWLAGLRRRHVIADAADTRNLIGEGIAACAAAVGVAVVPDDGLVAEIAGLVEWPVALLGRIDATFMDLPPEVMQVSMRVNQRYFATRTVDGMPAPYFVFVANIAAPDGGAMIVAGNERVLRARFSDARHFWDLDRRMTLADRVAALDGVTFHAALGSQGARVRRLVALAGVVADAIGASSAKAARAGLLAKADLTTGMVGEFPELQGVMGGYYARHDGEDDEVADAVRDHYAPKGPADPVPARPVSIAVALADKLDQLAGFFAIGEKPTGSGDPYALRRAALGIIRILRDNGLRVGLRGLIAAAAGGVARDVPESAAASAVTSEIMAFTAERLRVQLRAEGARHDVLAAVFASADDDDLLRVLARTQAVAAFLATADGGHLLAAYKRAVNILRIEERKDGPHDGAPDQAALQLPEEHALYMALHQMAGLDVSLRQEIFAAAMSQLATLRAPLDAFFDKVTVNAADIALRRNRLRLLSGVRDAMNRVADFSAIEN
jgi:glycyl-tRNA synthetase beta chain